MTTPRLRKILLSLAIAAMLVCAFVYANVAWILRQSGAARSIAWQVYAEYLDWQFTGDMKWPGSLLDNEKAIRALPVEVRIPLLADIGTQLWLDGIYAHSYAELVGKDRPFVLAELRLRESTTWWRNKRAKLWIDTWKNMED